MAQLSFEMLLGQFKLCQMSGTTISKYGNSFISRTISSLSSRFARLAKSEFQICFGALNLDKEQRLIMLQTKNIQHLSFHKSVTTNGGVYLTTNLIFQMVVIA